MAVQLNGRMPNTTGIGVMTWIRQRWSDPWIPAPNIQPMTAIKAAMPQGSSASFRYTYGTLFYPELGTTAHFSPIDLGGWYIAITTHNLWGFYIIWQGIVTGDSNMLGGVLAGGESGEIEFQAFGMELLLRQYDCQGSTIFDTANNEIRAIAQTLPVNTPPPGMNSEQEFKTRSENPDPVKNVYVFGDHDDWTNLEFLNYIVAEHVDQSVITWRLAGSGLWMLDKKCDPYHYAGLSAMDVIGKIVESYRGLSWSVEVVGQNAFIYVYSESALPYNFIELGNPGIAMNMNRMVFPDYGLHNINVNLSSSFADMFDEIKVEGNPIKTVATYKFSYFEDPIFDENTKYTEVLKPAWRADLDLDYTSAADAGRMDPKFADYLQKYEISDEFVQWTDISPICTPDGTVWTGGYVLPGSEDVYWHQGYLRSMKFDRVLPFGVNWDSTAGAFIDDGEDPPNPIFFYSEDGGNAVKSLDELELSFEIRALEIKPGFHLSTGNLPHLAADGMYAEGELQTEVPPVLDLRKMYVTASTTIDARPYLVYQRTPRSEIPRKLSVWVDAETILMAKQPVLRLDDGFSWRYEGDPLVRDERKKIENMMMNLISYCTLPRRQIQIGVETVDPGIPVGVMVVGVMNHARYYPTNTCVTSVQWNFSPGSPTTTVRTGGGELDLLRSAGMIEK